MKRKGQLHKAFKIQKFGATLALQNKFSCFDAGERSLIDLTLRFLFFNSGVISFTIVQILFFYLV